MGEVRDAGKGTSTNGNTARALFDEPEFLSQITSVPIHVINGIKKIWIAIRTTNYMHSDMFHEFAQKVKQDWRSAIPWYPLCASCHKIVEHGHICIRNSNIPVGYLGEDALESFFHDFKVFRYVICNSKVKYFKLKKRGKSE